MQAIQTQYKGYAFRSRLEARWAFFFDRIGLKYEYEPEGFVLDDGTYYLPDFKVYRATEPEVWDDIQVTASHYWCEIKPENIKHDDKFDKFHAKKILLSGDPYCYFFDPENNNRIICPRCGLISEFETVHKMWGTWINCNNCDYETPGGCGPMQEGIKKNWLYHTHKGAIDIHCDDFETIMKDIKFSARSARQARFGEKSETGESTYINRV